MSNGSEYTVKTSKDIKDVKGVKLGTDSELKTVFSDTAVPTLTGIRTLSTNQLEVTFSEPVQDASGVNNDITLRELDKDGLEVPGVISTSAPIASQNGKVWIVTMPTIKAGTNYNVYVNNAKGIVDYAGYVVPAVKQQIAYVADTTVPQATAIELLDQQYGIVTFNKPISTLSASNVFWNTDGVETNNTNIATAITRIDAQTFKVKFNLMNGGVKSFFVKGAVDYAGNVSPTAKFAKTVVEKVTPAVEDIKLVTKSTIKVTLNVDCEDTATVFTDLASAADKQKGRAFYKLTDKDAATVLVKSVAFGLKEDGITPDKSVRIITLYSDLGAGNSTLLVTGLKDVLGRVIADKTTTLSVDPMPVVNVSSRSLAGNAEVNKDQVLVNIDEKTSATVATSGDNSLLNVNNWTVTTAVGIKSLADVSGGVVTKVSSDVYMVSADKGSLNTVGAMTIGGLKTDAGKVIAPVNVAAPTATKTPDLSLTTGTSKFVASTTIAKDKITVKVNTIMSAINPADFRLYEDNVDQTSKYVQSVTYTNDSTTNADDVQQFVSTITITMKENLDLATKAYGLKLASANIGTKDAFGQKFVAGSGLVLQDTTKAAMVRSYVSDYTLNSNKIVLELDKDTIAANVKLADFTIKKADGTIITATGAGSGVTQGADLKKLIINLGTAALPKDAEVSVAFAKNISTALIADATTTTDSFRIKTVEFDSGAVAGLLQGDETITFTFNKTLSPDYAIVDGALNIQANLIPTILGSFGNTTIFGSPVTGDVQKYTVDGDTIEVKLSSLTDTDYIAPTGTMTFTAAASAVAGLESIEGIPMIIAQADIINLNPANLLAAKTVSTQFAPSSHSFTVSNNYAATPVLGDIDMDAVTTPAAVEALVVENGVTYTATINGGVVTIATTGTATLAAVAKDLVITINGAAGVTPKTVTLHIDAVAALGTPNFFIK